MPAYNALPPPANDQVLSLTIRISQGDEHAGGPHSACRAMPMVSVDIDAPNRFGTRNKQGDDFSGRSLHEAGGANWLEQLRSRILGALAGGSAASDKLSLGDLSTVLPGPDMASAEPGPGTNAALAASTLFNNKSGKIPELVDMAKLRDIANSTDPNAYTKAEKQAARFFVDNPDMFDLIESRSDLNRKDGKMSKGDISRWLGGDDKARDPGAHGIDVTSTSNPQAGNNIGAAKAMRTLLDMGRPVDNAELTKMTHSPDYTEQQRNAAQFMKANPHIWAIFETGGDIAKADGLAGGDDSRQVIMEKFPLYGWLDAGVGK